MLFCFLFSSLLKDQNVIILPFYIVLHEAIFMIITLLKSSLFSHLPNTDVRRTICVPITRISFNFHEKRVENGDWHPLQPLMRNKFQDLKEFQGSCFFLLHHLPWCLNGTTVSSEFASPVTPAASSVAF